MKFLRTSAAAMAAVIAATAISVSSIGVAGAITETDTSYLSNLGAASADSDFEYDFLDDGTIEITDYTGDVEELVIPSKIDGYTVTSIGYCAFEDCDGLISVTIPEGVTKIDDDAFYWCIGLTSVSMPDSLTSIGSYAFYHCGSLESVTIPDSVTSIGASAFAYCYDLAAVNISDSVTSIESRTFYDCDSLESVFIPDNLTNIETNAFSDCDSLKEINVASGNNSYSSKDGVLFDKSLTELLMYPKGKQEEEYIIPDDVTSIGDSAFYWSNLTSVTIPDSVTSIGEYAFYCCSVLTSVDMSDNMISIGDSAFEYCESLTSVTIPDSVTSIGYSAFSGCNALASVNIPAGITSIENYTFAYCNSLTSLTIPDTVTSIGDYAFYNCFINRSITIPENVSYIGYDFISEKTPFVNYKGTEKEWNAIDISDENDGLDQAEIFFNYKEHEHVEGEPIVERTPAGCVTDGYEKTTIYCETGGEGLYQGTETLYATGHSYGDWEILSQPTADVPGEKTHTCSVCGKTENKRIYLSLPRAGITFQMAGNYIFRDTIAQHNAAVYDPDYFYETGEVGPYPEIENYIYNVDGTFNDVYIDGNGSYSVSVSHACENKIGDSSVGYNFIKLSTNINTYIYPKVKLTIDKITLGGKEFIPENAVFSAENDNLTTEMQWGSLDPGELEYTFDDLVVCIYNTYTSDRVIDPWSVDADGNIKIDFTIEGMEYVYDPDPEPQVSESGLEYIVGMDNTAEIVGYIGDETELVIPNEIDGHSVTSIGYEAFWDCYSLTSVTIPDSVTSIGDLAFEYCYSLASVTIPNSVISIGNYAFYDCDSLTSVTIPDSVTSIGNNAFSDCDRLEKINVDTNNEYYASKDGVLFNKSFTELIKYPIKKQQEEYTIPDGVTGIESYAFENCYNLISVTIPDGITDIGYEAFKYCYSLESINIPDSVISIGSEAFFACYSLSSITIPVSVTSIGYNAFYSCDSLTSVTIPDSVEYIGETAFAGCNKLEEINVDANNKNYSSKDGVLFNKSLTELITYPKGKQVKEYTIPDSVTSIVGYAFYDCDNLESVTISDNVNVIGSWAFGYCDGLTSVTIPNSVTNIENNAFYDCYNLASVDIPNSVTIIKEGTFDSCYSLTSVTIPDSVTAIGYEAFANCYSLTSVTIPDSVTSIGSEAFENCDSLMSVDIPDSVTSIGYEAFENCDSLTSVTIPDNVTTIEFRAFSCCDSLEEIIVDTNNDYYASKDGVLFNKSLTELVTYPGGKQEEYTIPDSVTSIGDYAFYRCNNLTSITIPGSVKSIEYEAFYDCDNLTSLTISDGVEIIGEYSFQDCDGLTSVTIPGSVTTIEEGAFHYCYQLTSVTISEGVTGIGYEAFYDCPVLTSVTIPASVTRIESDAFECCSDDLIIYGYKNSYAEQYAAENDIEFVSLKELSDKDTGITIEGNDTSIPEGTVLSVEKTDMEENMISYNITLKNSEGKTVQPEDKITVMIPIPETWKDAQTIYVYYRGENTKLTDMHAHISGNYIVFETTHFSEYLITIDKQVTIEIGDVNGDGKVTMRDQMELARWLVGWDVQIDEDAADVNGDGKVTMRDQMTLARRIVGWDV